MPRGTKDIARRGEKTRFNRETAVKAAAKSSERRKVLAPVRKCLKNIASEALYGHPPLPDSQLEAVAKFFGITVKEVTFAHLAIFKQSVEMAKGDASALNLVAAYAGEKPTENVSITTGSHEALDEAFEALKGDAE